MESTRSRHRPSGKEYVFNLQASRVMFTAMSGDLHERHPEIRLQDHWGGPKRTTPMYLLDRDGGNMYEADVSPSVRELLLLAIEHGKRVRSQEITALLS